MGGFLTQAIPSQMGRAVYGDEVVNRIENATVLEA